MGLAGRPADLDGGSWRRHRGREDIGGKRYRRLRGGGAGEAGVVSMRLKGTDTTPGSLDAVEEGAEDLAAGCFGG